MSLLMSFPLVLLGCDSIAPSMVMAQTLDTDVSFVGPELVPGEILEPECVPQPVLNEDGTEGIAIGPNECIGLEPLLIGAEIPEEKLSPVGLMQDQEAVPNQQMVTVQKVEDTLRRGDALGWYLADKLNYRAGRTSEGWTMPDIEVYKADPRSHAPNALRLYPELAAKAKAEPARAE
jgi:hypothetical protein